MTYSPGTRFAADRIYPSGRTAHFTGTVIEDHGDGDSLLIRDDFDGHRKHFVIGQALLAKYGITQTITTA